MSSTNIKLFELKEAAKWSSKMDERKSAIRELASQGPDAISILEEIRDVIVAADELRDLCIAAIENIRKTGAAQRQELIVPKQESSPEKQEAPQMQG
jgi:hypothetical protein